MREKPKGENKDCSFYSLFIRRNNGDKPRDIPVSQAWMQLGCEIKQLMLISPTFPLVSATLLASKLSGWTSDATATSDLTQQHVHLAEHQRLRSKTSFFCSWNIRIPASTANRRVLNGLSASVSLKLAILC